MRDLCHSFYSTLYSDPRTSVEE
jgi:hypothetical protein